MSAILQPHALSLEPHPAPEPGVTTAPVIIVGGGPVGIRAAQELSRLGRDCIVFNAERWQPYNRVKLTSLLCGDAQIGQILQPLGFPGPGKVTLYSDQSIVDIDRQARIVTTKFGRRFGYDHLILAMGSRAHVPPIPGAGLSGVYTFRNADDVEKLVARSFRARRAVVIGGGLLGLEAARGLANRGAETLVVEHSPTLMPRQLDRRGGLMLARVLEGMGLAIRAGTGLAAITGETRVEGIRLNDGAVIPCDTVVICTGIRANMEMAREIGLAVGRGITVSASMRTTDPAIYAIGECAEFEGHIQGLVGPGFEQANIAAKAIAGEAARYAGSFAATKLKVSGADVFSMGDVEQIDQRHDVRALRFENAGKGVYRCVVLRGARLVGAMAIGEWAQVSRLQEAVRRQEMLLPWQMFRFTREGTIWRASAPRSVREWPREATVCNCTGVTRGQIGDAIAIGAASLDDIRRDTGASTVCGSCKVQIAELLGAPPKRSASGGWRWLGALSAAAALGAGLTVALPVWRTATTVAQIGWKDLLWLDGSWKQVSGFALLALCVLALTLSPRKRIRPLRLGAFDGWRIAHAALGIVALGVLAAHTGFRLGANLNAALVASFLGLSAAGAVAGLASAFEHRLFAAPAAAARLRSAAFWLHLVAFWPLPVLLAVHILSVYFY